MLQCPKCGSVNPDNASACNKCGAPFVQAAYQQQVVYTAPAATPGKGLAIAAMVCGIVSFFCFGVVLGILAVIFGAVAKKKGYTGGMATAGIVLGVIGLAFYLICLLIWGSALTALTGSLY